jgi:hypothetical protein
MVAQSGSEVNRLLDRILVASRSYGRAAIGRFEDLAAPA